MLRSLLASSVLAALFVASCTDSESVAPKPALPVADAGAVAPTQVCAGPLPAPEETFADKACPIHVPAQPDAFDAVLTKAGLDRCSLGYTAKDWSIFGGAFVKDPFRLPWYDEVHDHAVRAPAFARKLVTSLDAAAASTQPVTNALGVAAYGLGETAAPCVTPFELDAQNPLAAAVAKVVADGGGAADLPALIADAADVPLPLQRALAQVVLAGGAAEAAFRAVVSSLTAADLVQLGRVDAFTLRSKSGAPKVNDAATLSLLSTRFDERALARGAAELSLRIETAGLAAFAGATGFDFEAETPYGRIVVRDGKNHEHAPQGPVLLLVDTGGDDVYRYPAGAVDGSVKDAASHVGIAIDLAGKDRYGYVEVPDAQDGARLPADAGGRYHSAYTVVEDDGPVSLSEVPRQGAARLGYGMLFDLGGDADTYRSLRMSQGYGAAGVGVLYDAGGDDVYEGEAAMQGSAHFGIGLLLDAHGDDRYRAYSQAQGFAYARAVGILGDDEGSDRYDVDNGDPADGGDPLYWTIQIPGKGNNSFSQGAAWGRRSAGTKDDSLDMSGGLAILRDRQGDDTYVASVQAQASGYWFGTGILADGAGNDAYDARYYVQGAGAHFALALFLEDAGDDRYNDKLTPKATSIGVGHDFTVAFHLDLGGNDVYRGPGLSLGSGNANGIGVLLNIGGDDVYRAPGEPTLGAGNLSSEVNQSQPRRGVATTGIFLDAGGKDLYDVVSTVTRGDGVTWRNDREPAASGLTTEHGAGADLPEGTISFP